MSSSIARELDRRLQELDPATARHVEHLVREALALATLPPAPRDAMGYPAGYFEATAGCFGTEPLERPAALPLEHRDVW